jgi:hypothetical protein
VRGAFTQGAVDRIEIRHVQGTGEEARAYVFSGDQISGKGIGPEQIADQIMESISDDADNFAGVSAYGVLFFTPGEHDSPFLRIMLQFRGKADKLARNIESSEPANEKGLVAMAMRFANEQSQYAMRVMDLMHRENDAMRTRIHHLEDNTLKVKAVGEDLLDKQAERDRSRRRAEVVEKGFLNLMGTYGPHLLHKLLPAYVPPPQLVTPGNPTIQTTVIPGDLNKMEDLIAADIGVVLFSLSKKETASVTTAFKNEEARVKFGELGEILARHREGEASSRDVVDAVIRWAPLVPLDEQMVIIEIARTKPPAVMAALKECNDVVTAYVDKRMKEPQNGAPTEENKETSS